MKNKFIYLLLFVISFGSAYAQNEKLNFFIFVADDQYMDSLGCYNNGVTQTTPNIDAFASGALKFTNAYTPSAMCAPSRGALYSGIYPLRNGLHANHWKYFKEVKTLPDYFTDLGYESILVGKNHVKSKGDKHYKWSRQVANEERIPGDPSKHRTFNDEKISQLLSSLDKPFVMVYGSNLPHAPYIEAGYKGFQKYEASNKFVDDEFGRFMKIFKTLKLEENTVIIYLSDHGANIPWSKWTSYNRGVKIPVMVQWPGIKMSAESSALISMVDFLPTLLDAAGQEDLSSFDGKSLVNVIKDSSPSQHKEVFFAHTSMNINEVQEPYPIRAISDGRYKLIQNLNPSIKHPKTKGFYTGEATEWELYDTSKDKEEKVNVVFNPENRAVFEKLQKSLLAWRQSQQDGGLEAEKLMKPRTNTKKAEAKKKKQQGAKKGSRK